MRAARIQNALERLTAAIRNVEAELAAMKADHDPLASVELDYCRDAFNAFTLWHAKQIHQRLRLLPVLRRNLRTSGRKTSATSKAISSGVMACRFS